MTSNDISTPATKQPGTDAETETDAGQRRLDIINRGIRRCIIAGFTTIAVFFGGMGTWAALAPLDSAVIAPGVVVVQSKRKTVQHLEGGIIKEILVEEGVEVKAGDVLLRLDGTIARATLELLRGRYYAALAERARLAGLRGAYLSRIAKIRRGIAQTKLEKIQLFNKIRDQVVGRLRVVHETMLDLSERRRAARDVLARIDIVAPRDGVVVELRFHTLGGVVRPGESILDLMPRDDRLIVESRVRPDDIDTVQVGMPAQVRLTAYSSRKTPMVDGSVIYVSADRLTDPRTGEAYYAAKIEVPDSALAELDGINLVPGMAAVAMIRTGTRTALDYLIDPLAYSFSRAFVEE